MQKNTKKSKKIWIALAIIVGVILLSGAGIGIATAIKRANCEHVYGAWTVSEEVTCTEDGEEERECIECGKTETREIEHYGHEQRMVYAVEATCTEAGKTDGVQCIRCKKILVGCDEVPARGHKAVTVDGYRAECLKDGLTSGVKCSRCDKVIEAQKIIPATGHTVMTVEGQEPTCTEAGYTSHSYCAGCGEVYVEAEEIPALGHTDGVDVNSDVECERCGINGQEVYLEACQYEEAAAVTVLSQYETISAGEVAGAYRYDEDWSASVYGVSLLKASTFELVYGDTTTTEASGSLKVHTTALGKVYLAWGNLNGDLSFSIELESYAASGRIDFYMLETYTCEVTMNVIEYDEESGEETETSYTETVTIQIGAVEVRFDGLERLELIE